MTIQEQLQIINQNFEKLHSDFLRFDSDRSALEQKYDALAASIRDKYQTEKNLLKTTEEDVLKFYRIAKDNSRRELVSSGVSALKPDVARLNRMANLINIDSRDDYTAGQVVDLCSAYIAYINAQNQSILNRESAELKSNEQAKEREKQMLADKKRSVLQSCERYLKSEDVINLERLFETIHHDYEITNEYFSSWGSPIKRKRMMLIGYRQYKLDVPQMLCATLKASLKQHFDEKTKLVNCPQGFTTDTYEEIFVEYTELNEAALKSGIQALILNYLRYFKPTECKASVFDYIHYNADVLGPLAALATAKAGVIDKISSNEAGLKQAIAILADYYRKVETKIGVQTVLAYNKQHKPEERIPLRLIIIIRNEENFRTLNDGDLGYVINNAQKFGLTVLQLTKSKDDGSKGKDRENKHTPKGQDSIRIISDAKGNFYIENDAAWLPFQWLSSPSTIPQTFVDKVLAVIKPVKKGTKYFQRYTMQLPKKSMGKRKPIVLPFGVDEDDNVIRCSFENETFAAYIMGAAGSGKSTLLHTIISGILMNYHPDEVELWLLDFKMLEFKRYVNCRPPHIKYLLLEKSDDLVFDIIDRLTELLNKRQYIFSNNHWDKLTDVPPDVNMPAVFVIIDEFAQMSQILKETKGSGANRDYALKLENLLAKGRALGMKFIFASQTYTTGISGLTETACKQIQMRFALKNTPDEIKQTLTTSADELTAELSRSISSLPPYETLFKWRDENDELKIGRFRNMYTESGEIEKLITRINAAMKPLPYGSHTDNTTYIDKKPVLIDGNQPKPFSGQIPYYKQYEKGLDADDFDDSDVFVYPGVPCSFNLARPFILCNGAAENILLAGGKRDEKVNVLLSVMHSYSRTGNPIEIWSHTRTPVYRRYKGTVFSKHQQVTDLDAICERIYSMKEAVKNRTVSPALIICMGYEYLASDFEILGGDAEAYKSKKDSKPAPQHTQMDMNEILAKAEQCDDPDEIQRMFDEYNKQTEEYNLCQSEEDDAVPTIYDARDDMKWVISRASSYGVHFLFCFEQAQDFINLRMDGNMFRHKLLFSMSRDEATSIMSNRRASEIGDGVCLYSNGKAAYTMRPHIYRGVPCNGWIIDNNGNVIQRIQEG